MDEPLTKAVFLEFVQQINSRFTKLDNKVDELVKFQKYESEAIEYELEALVQKYLQRKYQLYTVKRFPAKHLYDPYTWSEISELDAAFLLRALV
jgi:hypothetical protein